MPRSKRSNVKEYSKRYREALRDCASYARQFPKGDRLRAYRDCIKRRLGAIEQVG